MVCLKGCSICGCSVLDDDLCSDCMKIVSEKALRREKIDKKKIKQVVGEKRMAEAQKALMAQLKTFNTCECCGRDLDK